jgi:hypothetical protein
MRFMLNPNRRGSIRLMLGSLAAGLATALVMGFWSEPYRALETRTTSWADGTLKEEWTVCRRDDGSFVRQGRYRSWYESGRPSEEGQYHGDHKTGLWQTWYELEPAVRAAVGHYVDGQKDGVWEYRMDPECLHAMAQTSAPKSCSCCSVPEEPAVTDRPDQVERYRQGVPDGLWIAWYPNGQISDSLVYDGGKLDGQAVSYHANGRLAALTVYRHGVRASGIQMWDPAGNPL